MDTDSHLIQRVAGVWRTATLELGVRAITPFEFSGSHGTHLCVANLPDFGGPNGMIVQLTQGPEFTTDHELIADARQAGVYVSFVNASNYGRVDLERFKEALVDWQYFGPPELCPEWCQEGAG